MDVPPANDLVLVIESSSFAHGFCYLEDAHAFALPEVVRLVPRLVRAVVEYGCSILECLQSKQVTRGQVNYM